MDPNAPGRKADHLRIAAEPGIEHTSGAGLDAIRLRHRALPERDLADVSLRCELLGAALGAPLVISAMTGGTDEAGVVNAAPRRGRRGAPDRARARLRPAAARRPGAAADVPPRGRAAAAAAPRQPGRRAGARRGRAAAGGAAGRAARRRRADDPPQRRAGGRPARGRAGVLRRPRGDRGDRRAARPAPGRRQGGRLRPRRRGRPRARAAPAWRRSTWPARAGRTGP